MLEWEFKCKTQSRQSKRFRRKSCSANDSSSHKENSHRKFAFEI